MKSPKKRSPCPIACTLDLIGDKWTLLIIRDLFAGKSHFHEFARSPERIATNILTDRLHRLELHRFLKSTPSTLRAGSSAYSLTDRGRSLFPLLLAFKDWGLTHIQGTQANVTVAPPG